VSDPYPTDNVPVVANFSTGETRVIADVTNFASQSVVNVPMDATSVSIGGTSFAIDRGVNRVAVDVKTGATIKNDFWWALGGVRRYGIKSVDAKIE
jgi:hypothetical protein